jgi:heptosyltransferase-2
MGRWESLPLGLSKAVIERSELVVSTDSGPRHIGIGFNKPVVSLFGSIDPSMTRSFNTPETLVRLGLECQPCGKHVCPLQHTRCMKDLGAEQVVQAVMQSWRHHERRAS